MTMYLVLCQSAGILSLEMGAAINIESISDAISG